MNLNKNEGVFGLENNYDLHLVGRSKEHSLTSTTTFVNNFADIVQTELQKSLFCIHLINQDSAHHQKELRFQLKILKEFWRLVPPSKNREGRAIKIMNKIAASREAIADCEERIAAIRRRVSVLQQELYALS